MTAAQFFAAVSQVVAFIKSWLFDIAAFLLIALLFLAVLKSFGYSPIKASISEYNLALLAGAFWLLRK